LAQSLSLNLSQFVEDRRVLAQISILGAKSENLVAEIP
jgi:hypothetical protein